MPLHTRLILADHPFSARTIDVTRKRYSFFYSTLVIHNKRHTSCRALASDPSIAIDRGSYRAREQH